MTYELDFGRAIRQHAAERPDQPALITARGLFGLKASWRYTSFAQFDQLADRMAHQISKLGVKPRERVLLFLLPSVETTAIFTALVRIGAIPVAISPGMGFKRFLDCIEEARPSVVIAISLFHLVRTLAPGKFKSVRLFITSGLWPSCAGPRLNFKDAKESSIFDARILEPDDEILIGYTSGSTGPAKGVAYTSRMIAMQARLLAASLGWSYGERVLLGFQGFGFYALICGVTSVIPAMGVARPAALKPERMIEAANRHQTSSAIASPIVWIHLVNRGEKVQLRKFETVRKIMTTGAPVAASLHKRLLAQLSPGAEVLTIYGATEALPLTTIGSAEVLAETGAISDKGFGTCVGRAYPGIDIRIIAISDAPLTAWREELRVARGELGEIVAGGEVVTPKYLDRPDADQLAKIRDGDRILHRMGDIGYLDEKGRLWFCGRKAERLETINGVIPPVPVENIFNQHPDVLRTALVGVGPKGSQVPVLCVEMQRGRLTSVIRQELRALAEGTRWDGLVSTFLEHPSFPVDPRHNSKIRRDQLTVFATQALSAMDRY